MALSLILVACQEGGADQSLTGSESSSAQHSAAPRKLVEVTPCVTTTYGRSSTPRPIADRVTLPDIVSLPADARVYAATPDESGESGFDSGFLIGPASGSCTLDLGGDGAEWAHVDLPPLNANTLVQLTFSPGGTGIVTDTFCPYIPDAVAVERALRGTMSDCSRPVEEKVTQLRIVGSPLQIAVVQVPPGVADLYLKPTGNNGLATFAVFTAKVTHGPMGPLLTVAREMTCTLPVDLRNICRAAFEYFIVAQVETQGVTEDRYTPVVKELDHLILQ
ncbi:MAG: hypothetical protein WBF75_12030 [Pseudonocardiaceae bacterium]